MSVILNYSIIAVIIFLSLIFPRWILLIGIVSILMTLSYSNLLPTVLSIGDIDIWLFDIIMIIVMLRSLIALRFHNHLLKIHPVYIALTGFLVIMAISSILAYYHFGAKIGIKEFIALLRFSVQVVSLPLIALIVTIEGKIESCQKLLSYIGYSAALLIYMNIFLLPYGFSFGEVQVTEGSARYFGLFGDQVGFILLFFFLWELLKKRWLAAIVFGGAIIATGTRGALITTAVGIGILFWKALNVPSLGKRLWTGVIVSLVILGALIVQDLGGTRSRFTGATLESGIEQRWKMISLAIRVILDHPLTGVGYMGFRHVADEYGARDVFGHWYAPNFIATAPNQYLQVATDGGIIGLISFLWLIFVLLRELKIAGKNDRFFAAAYIWLLSLLIGNQTAAWLLPGSFISYMLWLIMGLLIGIQSRSWRHQYKRPTMSYRS